MRAARGPQPMGGIWGSHPNRQVALSRSALDSYIKGSNHPLNLRNDYSPWPPEVNNGFVKFGKWPRRGLAGLCPRGGQLNCTPPSRSVAHQSRLHFVAGSTAARAAMASRQCSYSHQVCDEYASIQNTWPARACEGCNDRREGREGVVRNLD